MGDLKRLYEHLQLDQSEIRVLTLLPGNSDDPIECKLSKLHLHDQAQYSALSYVWGDQNDTKPITVNCIEFQATSNLETALRHLRNTKEKLIIWIDAVCMNQSDVEERNAQVQLMGQIYSKASTVFIWIGNGDEGSDNAFDSMDAINAGQLDNGAKTETASFYLTVGNRHWFRRVWTLQEMALASNDPIVVCGNRRAPWSIFMGAWHTIAGEMFSETEEMRRVLGPRGEGKKAEIMGKLKIDVLDELRQAVQAGPGEELRKLLIISRTSQSTDPRDRIYGLLGMLKAGEHGTEIKVDYSFSTAQVYIQAMANLFANGIGPYVLSGLWFQGLSPSIEGLPSWVPDFSSQTSGHAIGFSGTTFCPPDPLSVSGPGAGAHNGKLLDDGQTLSVEALPVDVIEDVFVLGQHFATAVSQLSDVEDLVAAARTRIVADPKLRPFFEKYRSSQPLWKVLISGSAFGSGYDEAPTGYEEQYAKLRAAKDDLPQHVHDATGMVEPDREYTNALRQHLPGRAFFTTRNGLFGLAIPEVGPGDEITIWFGATIPFVVRHEGDFCRLVGGAYVGGIMAGEMVDELYCEDVLDSKTLMVRWCGRARHGSWSLSYNTRSRLSPRISMDSGTWRGRLRHSEWSSTR